MTKVFIVRPFGNSRPVMKKMSDGTIAIVPVDFDKVESDLILPAMNVMGLKGGTTAVIYESGDIKQDMFEELLLADIVIADITIHNANVFYELGIRHALRDKRTILIKGPGFDETPFDIMGYKYISYDRMDPSKSLPLLITTIRDTMNAERKDSPVFNALPFLMMQEPEQYLTVPDDFKDEVTFAEGIKSIGKLNLLAWEAESFSWKYPALRLIGLVLFKLKSMESAMNVWEKIISYKPNDIQANDRLGTIYQRLAEKEMSFGMTDEALALSVRSDMAIDNVLNHLDLDRNQKAEALSLKARNAKMRWLAEWKGKEGPEQLKAALQSRELDAAFDLYQKGFIEDINHYYSGINALGLINIIISLAERQPGVWEDGFDTLEEAMTKLEDMRKQRDSLKYAVQFSIAAAKSKNKDKGITDMWLNVTEADLLCLLSNKPSRVVSCYEKALANADPLSIDSTTRQLAIYAVLGVLPENINAVLNRFPLVNAAKQVKEHCILFTGHMIDKPDRPTPRFPASMEAEVKERIKEKLVKEKARLGESIALKGIAGGACGGDILFHEVCAELDIPSKILLALPPGPFKQESVNFAGVEWTDRFDKLFTRLQHQTLADKKELPKWLLKKEKYDIWSRNNLWMLNSAMVNGGMNMTLIALWNGKGGDGPGGTEHMINVAKEMGARAIIIDI